MTGQKESIRNNVAERSDLILTLNALRKLRDSLREGSQAYLSAQRAIEYTKRRLVELDGELKGYRPPDILPSATKLEKSDDVVTEDPSRRP